MKKVIGIEEMHCEHCQANAEKALNAIPGVSAKVNLKKKEAVVTLSADVDDQLFQNALDPLEFKVTSIREKKSIFG